MLQFAPSTYYDARAIKRDPDLASARAKSDAALSVKIGAAWDANRKLYGVRKIWHAFRRQADHHHDLALHRFVAERVVHPESLCDWREAITQGLQVTTFFRHKAGSHVEAACGDIVELRRVGNVVTLISQISGNGRDDSAGR